MTLDHKNVNREHFNRGEHLCQMWRHSLKAFLRYCVHKVKNILVSCFSEVKFSSVALTEDKLEEVVEVCRKTGQASLHTR